MKSLLLFCAGLAAGITLGWLARAPAESPNPHRVAERAPASPRLHGASNSEGGGNAKASPVNSGRKAVAGHLKLALQASSLENDRLDDIAFGEKLAELIAGKEQTLEDRIEAEGMKTLLNPDRFLAFYQAYTKRRTLVDGDNDLNPMLTQLGQKYGRRMIETMSSKYPGGFVRMDSLIHGWAMSGPDDAVAWFNDLPDAYPQYDSALKGLVWGLTARDGAMAGKVLASLSPTDREKSMYSFASGFIHAHGLPAFDAWLKQAPAELAGPAILNAPQFAGYRSPEEFVPWFASHSPTLGIRRELKQGFDQWVVASPGHALDWLASLPVSQASVQTALSRALKNEAAYKFLSDNPNHPAAALIEASP